MFTLLTIAGSAIVLTAVYVLTAQTKPAEALAGETTLADSANPAETLVTRPTPTETNTEEWQLATVSALSDAEDLLDALENQGVQERELVVLGNSTFAVRWR